MLASIFQEQAPGFLTCLRGEYPTRFGPVSYQTHCFTPYPLKDYPPMSTRMTACINRASMSLARLDELGRNLPNPDLLRRPIARREAQSTSALEGTYERLETVLAEDYAAGDSKGAMTDSMHEVLNYVDAADFGIERIREGWPITMELVRQLQQMLVSGTRSDCGQAGTIRTSQVFIGSPTSRIEDARIVPMQPGWDLEIAVQAALDWWSSRTEPGLAVLDAALFHYQFETLHPFTDGNGRIGRLLILLQLLSRGLLSQPLLSLSPWFEQRRSDYQDCLLSVSTRADWESWVLFFSQGLEESCEDALLRAKRLLHIQEQYRRIVAEHRLGGSTLAIADLLVGSPVLTPARAARAAGKSLSSARYALEHLRELGIVSRMRVGRSNKYVAQDVQEAVVAPMGSNIVINAPLLRDRRASLA